MKMASLAIDQKILNNYSKPSLNQTKRYLSQARAKCNGMNIPTSFIYRSYLQKLANSLLNIENDITKSVKKIDEAIAKYNNVERRTSNKVRSLTAMVGDFDNDFSNSKVVKGVSNFVDKKVDDLGKTASKIGSTVSGWAKNAWSWIAGTAAPAIFDVLKKTGSLLAVTVQSLVSGVLQLVEALGDLLLLAVGGVASAFTGLVDAGQAIYGAVTGNEWHSVTKAMWQNDSWGGIKGLVSYQWVNKLNDVVNNSAYGKWLNENSFGDWARTDGMLAQVAQGIGYTAGVIALSVVTFGTATPLVLATTAGSLAVSKYTEEAWNNNKVSIDTGNGNYDMTLNYEELSKLSKDGKLIKEVQETDADGNVQTTQFVFTKNEDGSYSVTVNDQKFNCSVDETGILEGLAYGGINGAWEFGQWYVGSMIGGSSFSKIFGESGKYFLKAGTRIVLDSITGAAEVPFRTALDMGFNDMSWEEAWNKNGGWNGILSQTLIAGLMSTGGEVFDLGKIKLKSMKTGANFSDALKEAELSRVKVSSNKATEKDVATQLDDVNTKIEANKNEWFDLYQKSKQLSNSQSEAYYRAYGNAVGGNNEYANVIKRMEELKLEMSNLQSTKEILEGKLSRNVRILNEKIAIADNQASKGIEATIEIDNASELTMQQLVNIKNSDSKIFSLKGHRLSANDIMEVKSTNYVYTMLDYSEKYHKYLSMLDGASDDLKTIIRIADEGKTVSIPASEINNYNSIRAAQFELNQIKTRIDLNKAEFDLPTRVAYIDNFLKNSDDSARDVVIKKLMELSGSDTALCEQFADNLMILKSKYRDFRFEIEPDARAYWSSNNQKIVLGDNYSQTTLFHELGHAMFDTGYDGVAPSNFGSIKTTAAENLRHNVGGSLDSFKKYIIDSNDSYERILKEQADLFDRDMASEIYSSITRMYDDDINSIGQILKECGFDDNQVLDLLNGNSRNDTIDMVYNQYREKVIRSNASFEFETTGDSAVHDIISSIYDGGTVRVDIGDKRYGTIFEHDKEYYKGYYDSNGTFVNYTTDVSNDLKTHEQIANFVSLKLQHKDDKLKVLRDMLGDEWYNMMDSIYKNIIGG